jgi:phosphate transport system substrate-binding protein
MSSYRSFVFFQFVGLAWLTASLCACTQQAEKDPRQLTALVSIEGSDTMTVLVKAWANAFMKIDANVPISVTAGDSGGGIQALINRTTDVAAASRDLTQSEADAIRQKNIHIKRITVARDSIAIIVNPANNVKALTLAQLKGILSGGIKNWSEVGGKKQPVHVFCREETSGTYKFLKEHLLRNGPYASSASTVRTNEELSKAISKDKSAIGYIGMGTAMQAGNKIKILALKLSDKSAAVEPTANSTIMNYPLSRPLIMFMDENPKPSVNKFVNYCLSADGQKLVRESGYATLEKN